MRISDWSSDVCSSDLRPAQKFHRHRQPLRTARGARYSYRHDRHQPGRRRRADRRASTHVEEQQLMTNAELASAMVVDVGDLLRRIGDEGIEDGAALGKRGDREAKEFISASHEQERPDARTEEHNY